MITRQEPLPTLYLEPLDLLYSPSRTRTDAVPALGGAAAALSIAVWRPGTREPRTVVAVQDLPAWLKGLCDDERGRAEAILALGAACPNSAAFPQAPMRGRHLWAWSI